MLDVIQALAGVAGLLSTHACPVVEASSPGIPMPGCRMLSYLLLLPAIPSKIAHACLTGVIFSGDECHWSASTL
jgi:hypothetical protein